MWAGACDLYLQENYPLATFLSILVIEEVGKLTNLFTDLLLFDIERPIPRSVDDNHKRKQLIGVFSSALVNSRLDRVLGFDTVRKLLNIAQSNSLEKLRQDCLYIGIHDGRATTPRKRIDPERAKLFTVFAGEVMAEVLGHFPWEFERMLDSLIAFERSIGMPENKIERR
ncbi:MAG: AbiV family abortive infection protein [Rhodospirillaceae bacterium]|nr:AbiV family abortive infection protein [Rhodospirillaceae bacterium]